MENRNKIKLSEEQINFLINLPEQGMGYQIVNVLLKNGKTIENQIVLDSTFLQLDTDFIISTDEIQEIKLVEKL
jgi:hypothetical protein